MTPELVAIIGVGIGLGALLAPILLSINTRLQTLGERVAKIEGQNEMALRLRDRPAAP